MIGLLLLTNAMADITLRHSLPEHHVSGHPFVAELQVLNDGLEPETVQNLLEDRWTVQFTINQNGEQYTASTTKPEQTTIHQLTLPPRGVQELRFEVPNSAAWKAGTVTLTIQTPLHTTPYRQEITIHQDKVDRWDWQSASNSGFISQEDILWQNGDALFINPIAPRFVHTMAHDSQFGTSLHLGDNKHLYWTAKQNLYIQPLVGERFSNLQRAVIPWPKGSPIGPTFTTVDGRFMLPIWVPSTNTSDTGTMHMLIVTRQGKTTFRKLYTGVKPLECIGAINQAGTPLLAFRTLKHAWLLPVTEVGNAQVDRLPPQIIHLQTENAETETVAMGFGVSSETGLFIGMYSKANSGTSPSRDQSAKPNPLALIERRYSIQGKQLSETSSTFPELSLYHLSNAERAILTWAPSNPNAYFGLVEHNATRIWNADSPPVTIDTADKVAIRIENENLTVWSIKKGELKPVTISK